jgi:all-trans-8'-apo-beta-carotenal 15,15'-oxygenase
MQTARSSTSKPYRHQDWQGGNKAFKQELDYPITEIEGTIPPQLYGTLFRNVPAMLDVNGQPLHHPFDADGLICAIAFEKGRAYFRDRYVRTKGFCEEQKAQKICYRGVFGTQKPGGWLNNAFDLRLKNVANTNIVYWGGKLMALWEASHPYRLDPKTLETLGIETLDGVLETDSPFAAHPMIDPGDATREARLVTFGLQSGPSSKINLYELDTNAVVVQKQQYSVPGFAFIHDFAITPNYCIFFQAPLLINPLPYVLGLRGPAECLNFLDNRPTNVWLFPRNPAQPAQKLELETGFIFHHANAFERGNEIVVDSVVYPEFPALDHKLSYNEVQFEKVPPGQLWRFCLNRETGETHSQRIDSRSLDFPYIHPGYIGQQHRWIYVGAAHQPEGNAPLQAILKIAPDSGEQCLWSAAPKGFVGEPIFVPRDGATAQDDGWVLTVVYDAERDKSDVVILNADDLSVAARLHLRHHLPYGLHGCFVPQVF